MANVRGGLSFLGENRLNIGGEAIGKRQEAVGIDNKNYCLLPTAFILLSRFRKAGFSNNGDFDFTGIRQSLFKGVSDVAADLRCGFVCNVL